LFCSVVVAVFLRLLVGVNVASLNKKAHKNKRRENAPRRIAGTFSSIRLGVKTKRGKNRPKLKGLARFRRIARHARPRRLSFGMHVRRGSPGRRSNARAETRAFFPGHDVAEYPAFPTAPPFLVPAWVPSDPVTQGNLDR
jgi:hypothetical protein